MDEVGPASLPEIATDPPKRRANEVGKSNESSGDAPKPIDQVAWQESRDRRNLKHQELVDLIAAAADATGLKADETSYVDLWIGDDTIIEVKSLEHDDVKRARTALTQLLHYRYLYRDELPASTKLVAAFSRRPLGSKNELLDFLTSNSIAVVWPDEAGFRGSPGATSAFP